MFNSFFAKQCTYIETGSHLPTELLRRTNESLSTINFTEDDNLNVIRKLDPTKMNGHDQISIRMVQFVTKQFGNHYIWFFSSCIGSGIFPTEWKKANVVPIYKRGDEQNVKNYRPVSFLPIFGKKFERLIYNEMHSFFIGNDFISSNQSGFRQGDSCINQLLSITWHSSILRSRLWSIWCVFRYFKSIWQGLN